MAAFDHLNGPDFVRRVTAGDTAAFHELFEALAEPLARFVEGVGVPALSADEVAADALVKVNRALRTYRPDKGAKFTTWVFEIARRCAIDHYRAESRRAAEDAEVKHEYARAQARSIQTLDSTAAPSQAKLVELSEAMQALSENERDLLRMRQVMEYAEIAAAEQVSEQTIRVRHKRALDRLKQIVQSRRAHG